MPPSSLRSADSPLGEHHDHVRDAVYEQPRNESPHIDRQSDLPDYSDYEREEEQWLRDMTPSDRIPSHPSNSTLGDYHQYLELYDEEENEMIPQEDQVDVDEQLEWDSEVPEDKRRREKGKQPARDAADDESHTSQPLTPKLQRSLGELLRRTRGRSHGSQTSTPPNPPARTPLSPVIDPSGPDGPNFRIGRLIRNTDRVGMRIPPYFDIEDPNFTVQYGDYLLYLDSHDPLAIQSRFRNMSGQEGTIPHRMVQQVYRPWGLPNNLPLAEDGIPIPISIAAGSVGGMLAGEPVIEASSGGDISDIFNVDRELLEVPQRALLRLYGPDTYPWNLRVHEAWFAQVIDDCYGVAQDRRSNAPRRLDTPTESQPSASEGEDQSLEKLLDALAQRLLSLEDHPARLAHRRFFDAVSLVVIIIIDIMQQIADNADLDEEAQRREARAAYKSIEHRVSELLTLRGPSVVRGVDQAFVGVVAGILRRFIPEFGLSPEDSESYSPPGAASPGPPIDGDGGRPESGDDDDNDTQDDNDDEDYSDEGGPAKRTRGKIVARKDRKAEAAKKTAAKKTASRKAGPVAKPNFNFEIVIYTNKKSGKGKGKENEVSNEDVVPRPARPATRAETRKRRADDEDEDDNGGVGPGPSTRANRNKRQRKI